MKSRLALIPALCPLIAHADGQDGMAPWFQGMAIHAAMLYIIVLLIVILLSRKLRGTKLNPRVIINGLLISFTSIGAILMFTLWAGFVWYAAFSWPYIWLSELFK